MTSAADNLHENLVRQRRVLVLAGHLAELMPKGARMLDVGTGDGVLMRTLLELRPDLEVEGLETLSRNESQIPVQQYDGSRIPYADGSWNVVSFIDVLHHTLDPLVLLREAARVASDAVVIKDHTVRGILAGPTLRFMDRVGNRRFGVALPHNYWTTRQWEAAFAEMRMNPGVLRVQLGLYPSWANWLFGRKLHFLALLGRTGEPSELTW